IVIVVTGQNQILGIDGTTEPFHRIIQIVVNLHILNFSTMTHTHQSQTVDFVILTNRLPTFGNAYVFNNTTVIGRIIATVIANTMPAFPGYVTPRAVAVARTGITSTILRCKTSHTHATPLPQSTAITIQRTEGHRRCLGAFSHN